MEASREFLLISGLGMIVAGLTAYIITAILTVVHLRDKHPTVHQRLGGNIIAPRMLQWFIARRFRAIGDSGLSAIALPGSIGVWTIVAGSLAVILSKLIEYL
ncbi:MAG: hypothetical protein ABI451_04075 [Dokdonella sp.]